MIKIFLVEDETLALRALEYKINDLEEQYEIVGTATNGLQALEKIPLLRPSIVITDIRMPDMDGISLAKELKNRWPYIIPVILSGYQEFEYAQQAMRLGVHDYLLKPVSIDELRTCLSHCVEQIKQKNREKNVISFLIGENTHSFCPIEDKDEFTAAYLVVGSMINTPNNIIHPAVSSLSCERLEKLLSRHFPSSVSIHCFDGIFSNEKVFIFSGAQLDGPRLSQILQRSSYELEAELHSFVTVYFLSSQKASTLNNAILSCRTQAEQCMMLWKTRISCRPVDHPKAWPGLQKQAELFFLLLHQKQQSLLASNIFRLLTQWQEDQRTAAAIQSDLIFILEYFRYNGAKQPSVNSSLLVENLICFSENEKELADNFCQLLTHFDKPSDITGAFVSSGELVGQIDKFLKENLSRSLSLQMLSEEFGVSKVYLCRVFKKYKDLTPIDYFNRLKIQRAKELLMSYPQVPLREISEFLGFNDMYYFSKVFKRLTGMTPSEYKSTETS